MTDLFARLLKKVPWLALTALFFLSPATGRADSGSDPSFGDSVPAEAVKSESVALPFTAYSSSYLKIQQGPLTQLIGAGSGLPSAAAAVIDPAVRQTQKTESVMARFDALNAQVNGITEPLAPTFKGTSHFDPDVESWWGVCQQWSGAALDPKVEQFLSSTQGVVCRGTVLTQAEIKELITAFYHPVEISFKGAHNIDPYTENNAVAMGVLGSNPLSAADFHHMIFDYLRAGRGVVINRMPGPQVWNQPVYKASSNSRIIDPGQLPIRNPIPSRLLTAANPSAQALLNAYQKTEAALDQFSAPEGSLNQALYYKSIKLETMKPFASQPAGRSWLNPARYLDAAKTVRDTLKTPPEESKAYADRAQVVQTLSDQLVNEMSTSFHIDPARIGTTADPVERLAIIHQAWYQQVVHQLSSGALALPAGTVIKKVHSDLTMGRETDFAKNGQRSFNLGYDYLVFENDAQPLDSVWLSPLAGRPEFAWIPAHGTEAPGATDAENHALDELISIVQKCPGLGDAVAFTHALDQDAAKGNLGADERASLLNQYGRLKDVLDPAVLNAKLAHLHPAFTADELSQAAAAAASIPAKPAMSLWADSTPISPRDPRLSSVPADPAPLSPRDLGRSSVPSNPAPLPVPRHAVRRASPASTPVRAPAGGSSRGRIHSAVTVDPAASGTGN